jgi:hypothetical protein
MKVKYIDEVINQLREAVFFTNFSQSRNYQPFKKPEGSLPHWEESAILPCPETYESRRYPPIVFASDTF